MTFPENPSLIGLPSLHNECWEPLWGACEEHAVVVCCHIGSAGNSPYPSDESPIDAWITSMPISIANAAADWLFARFWKRYPGLRMALSEGGIGWIPYFLERADFTYEQHGAWTRTTFGKEKPSDVFRRHLVTCFADPAVGAVSGDLPMRPGVGDEQGSTSLYWRIERWIRINLGRVDSTFGTTGPFYAMRRELAK